MHIFGAFLLALSFIPLAPLTCAADPVTSPSAMPVVPAPSATMPVNSAASSAMPVSTPLQAEIPAPPTADMSKSVAAMEEKGKTENIRPDFELAHDPDGADETGQNVQPDFRAARRSGAGLPADRLSGLPAEHRTEPGPERTGRKRCPAKTEPGEHGGL